MCLSIIIYALGASNLRNTSSFMQPFINSSRDITLSELTSIFSNILFTLSSDENSENGMSLLRAPPSSSNIDLN